jgi:hypothetical protein
MTADVNLCEGCGWAESGEDINPHRLKCPVCGNTFGMTETVRRFTDASGVGEL